MLKKAITIHILILFSGLILNAEIKENIGFLQNQKYQCIVREFILGDRIEKLSIEEGSKFVTRFYVDNNMILHTDGKTYNKLTYDVKNKYFTDDDSIIQLFVEGNKKYFFRLQLKGKTKGITSKNLCLETDKWTIN